MNYYVDGTPWQTMTPGDIDNFVRPDELVAVEVYHGSKTPPQFQTPGQSMRDDRGLDAGQGQHDVEEEEEAVIDVFSRASRLTPPSTVHLYERRRWTRQRWALFVVGICRMLRARSALRALGREQQPRLVARAAVGAELDDPHASAAARSCSTVDAGVPVVRHEHLADPGRRVVAGGSGSRRERRHLAVQLLVVQVGSYLLNPSLKALFDRARPDLFERRGWYGWSSYPSGHAIASVSVLMTIAMILHQVKGWRWPFYVALTIMLCEHVLAHVSRACIGRRTSSPARSSAAAWLAVTAWAFREHFEPIPESARGRARVSEIDDSFVTSMLPPLTMAATRSPSRIGIARVQHGRRRRRARRSPRASWC